MYNRNDNAYGDERRRWNADDRYTQSSRYQDTGISSGLRGNDYQSRQSLMSTNYDDIRYFNANSGRVALLQENEMRRQETLERRSDSYGSGGQYGGFRVRGDRPRKSVYDEGPYHRQETERYPPRREEPLRGRGLLGEPEQQFLRPQPNMVHQMESEAKLALANTLINALVQSQQQPVLPTPAPWMAQPLMNASLFGGGVRGRRDEPRYRRDEARGYGQKMTRKVKPRKKLHIEIPAWQKYYALLHFLIMIPAYEMFAGSVKLLTTIQIIGFSLYFLFSLTSIGMIYDNHPMSAICEIVRSAVFMVLTSIYTFGINSSVLMAFRIYFVLSALCWSVLRQVNLSEEKKDI